MTAIEVRHGDCLDVMRSLDPETVDAVVTDPPYGLSFMGRAWDHGVPGVPFWTEMLRVLKPGAHLVAFGGTRTYHRLACAVEDAGFEIRDMLSWLYGTGFPKSLDVSKAIDKAAGVKRNVIGRSNRAIGPSQIQNKPFARGISLETQGLITAPATPEATEWEGWGTALKPACEPIVFARKPLSEATVAANVLRWGTGAINIDGCRVACDDDTARPSYERKTSKGTPGGAFGNAERVRHMVDEPIVSGGHKSGRFPANVIHDGSAEVLERFPRAKGAVSNGRKGVDGACFGHYESMPQKLGYGDDGSAARFFYSAKANKADRASSKHPTVKPVDLMGWLCRLVTPPGGLVLDPFAGSGTTGEACLREGFRVILIEREAEYVADIRRRLGRPSGDDTPLFAGAAE